MVQIISRAEWGARPPIRRHSIVTPTPKLYLHHAAGAVLPGDDSVSPEDLRRIRSIQNYHMDNRGWSDIAYSFLMDPDGNVFEGRGAGIAGGHTAGQNTVSHAICIMGHYDLQAVDSDLVPRLAEFVRYGHGQGWWPLGFTGGHRDAPGASTSCPGANLYSRLPEINRLILEDDMTPDEVRLLALEPIIQALQRQPVAWYRALQAATGGPEKGTPRGNADFWGADFKPPAGQSKPTLAEWQANAVTIHAAALRVGIAVGSPGATVDEVIAGIKARL